MNNCNSIDIANWYTYNSQESSVDYLHTCLSSPLLQPPNTVRGYSYPHAGVGMAGICYLKETDYRETVSVALSELLIKDSAYCVTFWVKNSKLENIYYWVEQIGLLFTIDTIDGIIIRNSIPHIKSTELLDQNEWVEISGYYIASGNEKFLNIGFFGITVEKYISQPLSSGSAPFYFLDDVSVYPCDKDSILSGVLELPNVMTLDNNLINEQYLIRKNNIKTLDIQIFNRWGNLVRHYDGINEVWNGSDDNGNQLSGGVYFLKAIAETSFGKVINKSQYVHLIIP